MITTNLSLTFFSTGGTPVTTTNIPVELDTEYHVAVVGQSGTIKVWVNGIESGSITFPAGITFPNDTLTFNAAYVDSTTGVPVSGCDYSVIDDVKIYKNLAKYISGNTYPEVLEVQSGTNSFNSLSLLESTYQAIGMGMSLGWAISAEADFEVPVDLSWSVIGPIIFLETNFPISWDIVEDPNFFLDLSWDISTAEVILPISWELMDTVSTSHHLSWDLQPSLTKTLTLGYGIGNGYQISTALPLSWNVVDPISSTLSMSWDLLTPISQSTNLSWELASPISKVVDIINFVNFETSSNLVISNDIMDSISRVMDLKYNIGIPE